MDLTHTHFPLPQKTMASGSSKVIRTPFPHSLPILILFLFTSFLPLPAASLPAVGLGYRIRSSHVDPAGKTLTADLDLIGTSQVYGPDLPTLTLQAT